MKMNWKHIPWEEINKYGQYQQLHYHKHIHQSKQHM
jgi:hypothetical protein